MKKRDSWRGNNLESQSFESISANGIREITDRVFIHEMRDLVRTSDKVHSCKSVVKIQYPRAAPGQSEMIRGLKSGANQLVSTFMDIVLLR